MMCRLRAALALALAIAIAATLSAATTALADDQYRINVLQADASGFPEIRVVATVADSSGDAAQGLRPADLQILEEGQPQVAATQLVADMAPVVLVIAVDTSGSMAGQPLADAQAAVVSLLRTLQPQDRAAIIAFNTEATVVQSLTSDREALVAATQRLTPAGNTALYDALDSSLALLAGTPANARTAVVLLSDGADNASRTSLAATLGRIRSQAHGLFVIGLGDRIDENALRAVAAGTPTGRLILAPTSASLTAIYTSLGKQLRTQYALSYRSTLTRPTRGAVTLTLRIQRDGATLGATTIEVPVPAAPPVEITPMENQGLPIGTVSPSTAPVGVALLGSAAAVSLVFGAYVGATRARERERRRRLQEFVGEHAEAGAPRRASATRSGVAALRRGAAPVGRFVPPSLISATSEHLARAGTPLGLTAVEFLALRVLVAAVLGVIGAALLALASARLDQAALGFLGGALLGYLLPSLVLGWRIRRRQHEILKALAPALDLLALSTAAGMTLDGAIAQVTQRWHTVLSDELRRFLAEVRVGGERRVALEAMARRIGLPEVSRLTTAIVQSDTLGVPIARVLQNQARELRQRRRQRAEQAARIAPVKMLFPMILLILPALFVVIIGPAVPQALEAMGALR